MHTPAPPARPPRPRGFTLIELLIGLVVVGILAAIALPAFNNSIRKSRRSDAFAALSALQQAQERWRGNHGSYADNGLLTLASTASPPGLGLSATSGSGYYAIVIASADATGYVATATAVSGSTQANDSGCQVLAVRMQDGNAASGSGASSVDWTDPQRCWAR
jgi:type IV pilus assembly protein PilE